MPLEQWAVQTAQQHRADVIRRKAEGRVQRKIAARQRIRLVTVCDSCWRSFDVDRGVVTPQNYRAHYAGMCCDDQRLSEPQWLDPQSGKLLTEDEYKKLTE